MATGCIGPSAGKERPPQDDKVSYGGAMKLGWIICAVLFQASVVFGVAQDPTPPKTLGPLEQSLIAGEKSLIEAKKKDDGAFFKRTVSEDFALVGVDGKLLEGQEAVDDLGDSGLTELTPYDIKVVAAGEGAAIVTYDAIVRKAPEEDQGPPPRYQHFSSVWVKQGDGWKLKFHQATAVHWGDW
ncbi:MAG: nuclear transport factor 2 family protein [Candidatus Sulfotelmatobacter sp.]